MAERISCNKQDIKNHVDKVLRISKEFEKRCNERTPYMVEYFERMKGRHGLELLNG